MFSHNNYIDNILYNKIVKLTVDKNVVRKEFTIELNLIDEETKKTLKRNLMIRLEDINSLVRNINNYNLIKTILLLPGPLPVFRFDDGIPTLSEGIDLFIRPFKQIFIFVDQGKDYIRAYEQMAKIKEFLFSTKSNSITKMDLHLSYTFNNTYFMKNKLKSILSHIENNKKFEVSKALENTPELNGTLENSIRKEYIRNEKRESPVYYSELNDLWDRLSKTNTKYENNSRYDSADVIQIRVKFENTGKEETIAFPHGMYIRLIDEKDTDIISVDDLKSGQKIAYMQSDTKESLDNFFIRNYSDYNNNTLEEIYEPFRCLGIFYKTVSKIDFSQDYSSSYFESLYWLKEEEKMQIYSDIHYLLEPIAPNILNLGDDIKNHFSRSIVWKFLADVDSELLVMAKEKFQTVGTITIDTVYGLALLFGLNYEESSFKGLMQSLNNGRNKYYFFDENNLLAIARMMHFCKISENYQTLTTIGKDIRTVLQYVGASLKRVVTGKTNYISDMDLIIEKNIMICTVL